MTCSKLIYSVMAMMIVGCNILRKYNVNLTNMWGGGAEVGKCVYLNRKNQGRFFSIKKKE